MDDDLVDEPRRSPATVVATHDNLGHVANLVAVDVELVDSAEQTDTLTNNNIPPPEDAICLFFGKVVVNRFHG